MPIVSADIDYFLSGGTSNTNVNLSIGGARSTSTEVTDNVDNNLFDDVSGAEHTAGHEDYRCIYVRNSHGSLSLDNAVVWRQSPTTGAESEIAIAVGTAAVNGVEQGPLANEITPPTGVTWSTTATTRATGLALGNLPAGQHKAVWIRRTITAGSTPQAADTCAIQAGGDTL